MCALLQPVAAPLPLGRGPGVGQGDRSGCAAASAFQERCLHGWWAAAAVCAGLWLSTPRVLPSPSCGTCHPLRGLWRQRLGKAAEHLARPVQLLCRALPRNAFGTQQWMKLSFIPAPWCPSCSQKSPQGHLCCPVPVHSAEHEQVLCLDQLLRLSVLMEALGPPGALAEPVLPPVPGKSSVLASMLHSMVTTV